MKKKTFILSTLACFLFVQTATYGADFRRASSFEDAFAASCRVSVSGARGSGTFIGARGDDAYILTNYHVVTSSTTATLDFWTNGKRESITGRIDWRYYDANMPADFARIVVSASELKRINPPYVAIGGSDAKPGVGAFIVSSGAPDGRFTQAWKGQILEYYNNKTCVFSPPPVPGQSGSGICEYVDGELFLTGVLTWLLGEKGRDDSKGGAIPISNLYSALQRRPEPTAFEENATAIPPDATECAERNIVAYEFYKSDCAACVKVASSVDKLSNEGKVIKVNTDTMEGAALATKYNVKLLPSIVISINEEPVRLISYDEMLKDGVETALGSALEALNDELDKLPEDDRNAQETPLEAIENKPTEYESLSPSLFIVPDFRSRPSVHETPYDVGIFSDSENCWRNRGNKTSPSPFVPKVAPKEDKRSGGIFENNGNYLDNQIQRYTDKVMESMIEKLKVFIRRIRFVCLCILTFIIVVGCLIAESVKVIFFKILKNVRSLLSSVLLKAAEKVEKTGNKNKEN